MEQMAQRYPDDFEAQVFYALTLQASASKSRQDLRQPAQVRRRSSRGCSSRTREHPGVAHYMVHAYDYPPLADRGIRPPPRTPASRRPCRTRATCRRTSTRWWGCGRTRSPRTCRRSRSSPTTTTPTDFMVYAHLQLAQDAKAKALVDPMAPPRRVRGDARRRRQLHGACGDAGALRARARRLGRRGRACRSCRRDSRRPTRSPASLAGSAWPAAAIWPAPGARFEALQELRARAGEVGPELLGRSHRGADPRRLRLGGARRGLERRGA